MLFVGDIPRSPSDVMLAVRVELLSEVASIDKMLIGGEGRRGIVGVKPVVELLGVSVGLVVPAELVFLVPALVFCADISEPVPMLALPVVLVIFLLQASARRAA